MEMVCVGQHKARTRLLNLSGCQSLHGGLSADRGKNRRSQFAVGSVKATGSSAAAGACNGEFEHHGDYKRGMHIVRAGGAYLRVPSGRPKKTPKALGVLVGPRLSSRGHAALRRALPISCRANLGLGGGLRSPGSDRGLGSQRRRRFSVRWKLGWGCGRREAWSGRRGNRERRRRCGRRRWGDCHGDRRCPRWSGDRGSADVQITVAGCGKDEAANGSQEAKQEEPIYESLQVIPDAAQSGADAAPQYAAEGL